MEELNVKLKAELNAELEAALQQYKESEFYKNYAGTYFSDKILKEVFNCELKLHRLYGLNNKSYKEIHQMNVEHICELITEFGGKFSVEGRDIVWGMIYAIYIDPDSNAIKQIGNIRCTADGLFSIKRIYRKNGASEKTITDYETYRKEPIFFFPEERNGINMTRNAVFGDRIDHTLFDLKNYFEEVAKGDAGNIENCKLCSAYKLPKTSEWLREIGSFEKLVDLYDIKDTFVNDEYEVYDIEKGNGKVRVITNYKEKYEWLWSDTYYRNLKNRIEGFVSNSLESLKSTTLVIYSKDNIIARVDNDKVEIYERTYGLFMFGSESPESEDVLRFLKDRHFKIGKYNKYRGRNFSDFIWIKQDNEPLTWDDVKDLI